MYIYIYILLYISLYISPQPEHLRHPAAETRAHVVPPALELRQERGAQQLRHHNESVLHYFHDGGDVWSTFP